MNIILAEALRAFHGNVNMEVIECKDGWLDLQYLSRCVQNIFPIVMCSDGVCCCLYVTYLHCLQHFTT